MQRKLAIFTCIAALAVLSSTAEAGTAQTLRYMPADTAAYISVDVTKARTSPLGEVFFGALESDRSVKRDLAKFKKATGLDFRRHISAASIFFPGSMLDGKSEHFLIVAEGQFQKRRIEALIRKESKSVKVQRHAGRKLLIIDNEGALVFDGRYALLGTIAQVKSGLRNRASGGRVAPRLKQAMGLGGDIHGGVVLSMSIRQQLGRDLPQAKDLVAASGKLHLRRVLGIEVRLMFANARAAKDTAKLIDSTTRRLAGDPGIRDLGLSSTINIIRARSSGKLVTIRTAANAAQLAQLAKKMLKL